MTKTPAAGTAQRGLSTAALILGLLSLAMILVFVFGSVGVLLLYGGIMCGLAAIVIGIIALTMRQPKALALTGLILGGTVVLLGLALIVFALLFVGAI